MAAKVARRQSFPLPKGLRYGAVYGYKNHISSFCSSSKGAVIPIAFTTSSTERVETRCTHASSMTVTGAFSAAHRGARKAGEQLHFPQLAMASSTGRRAPPRSAQPLELVNCRGAALPVSGRGSPSTPISVTRLATKPIIS